MLEGFKDALRNWVGPALATYSYEDLSVATDDFHPKCIIGSGATGKVYRGVLRGATDVAIKVLRSKSGDSSFDEELKALTWIRHPNIVALLGYGENEGWKYIVYELLKGGSVARRLWRCRNGKEPFAWEQRLRIACDASCGLSYMVNSEPKAFHRDIKPSNILLDEHGTAKLSDFGLVGIAARQTSLIVEHISGSPGYICPVYFETGEVTEYSEVFSFGIVLLELLVNRDAAALGPNGAIVYPLSEALRYTQSGALKRVLACLDQRTTWPHTIAGAVAQLALACVGEIDKRMLFMQIVQELRQVAMDFYPGNRAASNLPLENARNQQMIRAGQMLADTRALQQQALTSQCRSSVVSGSDVNCIHTILPDSLMGPETSSSWSYSASETSLGSRLQLGLSEAIARSCATTCSTIASLQTGFARFALESQASQDFASEFSERDFVAEKAPSMNLAEQGASCSKAKLRAELEKRPIALKVDLDRRSLLI